MDFSTDEETPTPLYHISKNMILREVFAHLRKNDLNIFATEIYLFQRSKGKISMKPLKEKEDVHYNHIRVRESIM